MTDGMRVLRFSPRSSGGKGKNKSVYKLCITATLASDLEDFEFADGWEVLREAPKPGSVQPSNQKDGSTDSPIRSISFLLGPRMKELLQTAGVWPIKAERKTKGKSSKTTSDASRSSTKREGAAAEADDAIPSKQNTAQEVKPKKIAERSNIGGPVIARMTVTGQRGTVEHALLTPTVYSAGSAKHVEPGSDSDELLLIRKFDIPGTFGGLVEGSTKGIANPMDVVARSGLETAKEVLSMVSNQLVLQLNIGKPELVKFWGTLNGNSSLNGLGVKTTSVTPSARQLIKLVQEVTESLRVKVSPYDDDTNESEGSGDSAKEEEDSNSDAGNPWLNTTTSWADLCEEDQNDLSDMKKKFGTEDLKYLVLKEASALATRLHDLTPEECSNISEKLCSLCLEIHKKDEVEVCTEVRMQKEDFQIVSLLLSPLRKAELLSHSHQNATNESERMREKSSSRPTPFTILPEYVNSSSRVSTDIRSFESASWMLDEDLITDARAVIEVVTPYVKAVETWLMHVVQPTFWSKLQGMLALKRIMTIPQAEGRKAFRSWENFQHNVSIWDPLGKAISSIAIDEVGMFFPRSVKEATDAIRATTEKERKKTLEFLTALHADVTNIADVSVYGDRDKVTKAIEAITEYLAKLGNFNTTDLPSDLRTDLNSRFNFAVLQRGTLESRLDNL